MSIRSGNLSDRIMLEPIVWTQNPGGQMVESAGTIFTLPAEATRLSETAARFIIRYRSDVKLDEHGPTHRIYFWNAKWTVNSAVPDRRNTILTIDSNFDSLIEVTHLQSTSKEYIEGVATVRPQE